MISFAVSTAAINPGVRAAIINDVDGPRLIVASNVSGGDNDISMRAEAQPGDTLKQLEYKTLEQRVKDLERARAAAQELIAPLTPAEKKVADKVAQKIIDAAKVVDQEIAVPLSKRQ